MHPLLPHAKSNHTNLETISKVGLAQWLSEQENKWKCPRCKSGFSWYTRKCNNCGENLKKYTFKFTFLQSTILKLGIYVFLDKQK
jgi:predicted amidophosphoribosyltransferase